jgi:hypothetical protein
MMVGNIDVFHIYDCSQARIIPTPSFILFHFLSPPPRKAKVYRLLVALLVGRHPLPSFLSSNNNTNQQGTKRGRMDGL